MAFRAVLFDLDGTLLDTLEDIAVSMNRALMENGFPQHPINAYRYFVGDGVKTLARRVTGLEDGFEPVLKAYQAYYALECRNRTQPYEGIPKMLESLSRLGLPLCIFSNKPHDGTLAVVKGYFPQITFACVRGQMEGVPVKPDPTGALQIARELNIDPADFLYVGDTGVYMDCAKAAGMVPVGALWGFRTREELLEHGARHLIANPAEILALVR